MPPSTVLDIILPSPTCLHRSSPQTTTATLHHFKLPSSPYTASSLVALHILTSPPQDAATLHCRNKPPSPLATPHTIALDNLPPKEIFVEALYTFDIGQNDFTSNLAAIGIGGVKQFLPQVANQIGWTIKDLHNIGGRMFMVFNLAPIGCFPSFLTLLPHSSSDLDEYGCMMSYNNAVADYNKMLKETLQQIRSELQNAYVIYVDTHTVKLELFQHPQNHGLMYGTKSCCGSGGGAYNFNPQVFCGNSKEINGMTVTASACSDPQNYVSWDGIHATEAANKIIAWSVLSGSYFDPPFPLSELCNINPIG